MRNGNGTLTSFREIYTGDWKDDEKNGKGIFYLAGGNKYEGDLKDIPGIGAEKKVK